MAGKRFSAVVLLSMCLAVSACSPQPADLAAQTRVGQPLPSPETQPASLPATVTVSATAAKPAEVSISLEKDRQAAMDIHEKGGMVTAASSSGVAYQLRIPAGALPGDYSIRMTPVAAVEGLPLSGGVFGAVQLEPEGLVLLQPAVLTISLPPGASPASVIAFAYQGSGQNPGLYPAAVEGGQLVFQISHFSGYGGGQGTPSEASSLAGDYLSQIAGYMRDHPDSLDGSELLELFRKWFNEEIYPDLQKAETDDSTLDQAMGAYISWSYWVKMVNLEDDLLSELKRGLTSLMRGLAHAVDQAYQRCMQVDAYQGVKMVRRIRQLALLNGGYGVSVPPGYTLEEKAPELKSCLTFTLQLESSVMQMDENSPELFSTHVSGEVILRLNTETWRYDGSGSLKTLEYLVDGMEGAREEDDTYDCGNYTYPDGETTATLEVKDALIAWTGDEDNPQARVELVIEPGDLMTGRASYTCWMILTDGSKNEGPVEEMPSSPFWTGAFEILHADKAVEDGYLFTGFQTGASPIFAHLSLPSEFLESPFVLSENLVLDVLHTPGK